MNSSPSTVGQALRRLAGFTLIELLVTMVVGSLLIIFLFQIFNATTNAWRRGESQNDTYREARAAMQMMVRDLSQTSAPILAAASPTPLPTASPAATPTPAPGIAPVLVLKRYSDYLTPDPAPASGDGINEEVYCLTNVPNSGTSGLCAVGYFCSWMPDLIANDDPQGSQKRTRAPQAFALMRQFLPSGRPGPTDGTDSVAGLFTLFRAAKGRSLRFDDIFKRVRPGSPEPGADTAVASTTQLSSYIWDLQFRTVDTLQNDSPPSIYTGLPPYPPALPAYVEIRFKALSEAAARQLEGNSSVLRTTWSQPKDSIYQRIILPGTRQFVARAPIYGGIAARNSTSTTFP